jgi:hypothetical protein
MEENGQFHALGTLILRQEPLAPGEWVLQLSECCLRSCLELNPELSPYIVTRRIVYFSQMTTLNYRVIFIVISTTQSNAQKPLSDFNSPLAERKLKERGKPINVCFNCVQI